MCAIHTNHDCSETMSDQVPSLWEHMQRSHGVVMQSVNDPVKSLDGIKQHMEPHFDLIEQENIPYLIRHHARKYDWGVSCATVWRRRRDKA